MENQLPLPNTLPVGKEFQLGDIEDAALRLYQRVAEADQRSGEIEQRLRAEMAENGRRAERLIAMLAVERFEFDRLMRRLAPQLEQRKADDLLQLLNLFARAWDLKLSRAAIQVMDLAGFPLTDDLLGEVDVESHVPEPTTAETIVRETLLPLVKLEGRTIGAAKIVTSVPVISVSTEEKAQ